MAERSLAADSACTARSRAGTLHIDRGTQQATFAAGRPTGDRSTSSVAGSIPDNLAEGMEVVVEGQLERQNLVRGHKVMTKCRSKYTVAR